MFIKKNLCTVLMVFPKNVAKFPWCRYLTIEQCLVGYPCTMFPPTQYALEVEMPASKYDLGILWCQRPVLLETMGVLESSPCVGTCPLQAPFQNLQVFPNLDWATIPPQSSFSDQRGPGIGN